MSQTIRSRLAQAVSLFATPLAPSHYLAMVSPLLATHTLYARVEAVRDETADARTLTLRPGRGFRRHRAGQHLRVGVTVDGRLMSRTYSIASGEERADGCVEITVKAIEGGRVSQHLARRVAPGEHLTVGQPEGDFVRPDVTSSPLLFVTGGSGITPIMSMLRTFAARAALPDIVHVHYAKDAADVIFRDELSAIAAAHPRYRLHTVHTREFPAYARHLGGEQLDILCPDWATRRAFACGPAGLLETIEELYTAAGAGSQLSIERFAAKLATPPANAQGGAVSFAKSGRLARGDGKTPLLLVAESAGVRAPHGCRMGICHSCDATVVSGCVRDLRTGEVTREAGARVQICVCAAEGDVAIDL